MSQIDIEAIAGAADLARLPGIRHLWEESQSAENLTIAVLDGPVDLSHECFRGANVSFAGTTFDDNSSDGAASHHGTHVASLIFGQPGTSVHGVAPRCRGLVIPIFSEAADGALKPASQVELARAISLAVGHGANVINISAGQFEPSGKAHPALEAAVQLCAKNNVLIVAAAGNNGCQCLHVPAAIDSVLVVGAMDEDGKPMEFSNWGEPYETTGVLALGKDIKGAVPGGATGAQSGTSCATPIVSGVAALLLDVQQRQDGQRDVHEVRRAIIETAIDCNQEPVSDCRRLLAGRLNIRGALTKILKGAESEMSDQMNSAETPAIPRSTESCSAASPTVAAQSTAAVSATPAERSESDAAASTNGEAGSSVYAAACKCGGGETQLVYEIGKIGYDFRTETNLDYFIQQAAEHPVTKEPLNPGIPSDLLLHFDANPYDASALTWLLLHDNTPIYAIQPVGPFAAETFAKLREFLTDQLSEEVDRVSIPGMVAGKATLLNGQSVPVIVPDIRGMYDWTTAALILDVLGDPPAGYPENEEEITSESPVEFQNYKNSKDDVKVFLNRVYYDTRNFGLSPQERALNYAATNAFQVAEVFKSAIKDGYKLAGIDVERSLVCRPGADCWDVKLSFFNPPKRFEVAKRVYRFTIDVTETIPVTVGEIRSWEEF
jgi:cyanobactin maturation PatA/PatG family protease